MRVTSRAACSGQARPGVAAAAAPRPRPRPPARRVGPCAAAPPGAGPPDGPAEGSDDSLTMPVAGDLDWRAFRAQLVAATASTSSEDEASPSSATSSAAAPPSALSPPRPTSADGEALWAHHIAEPERGCLLVAHPLMFTTAQTYFSQAVIFIIEHGPEGTAGLILNKPTQYTLGQVGGVEALCPTFAGARLMLGGDVERASLHALHDVDIPGSVPVIPGVRVGGVDAASDAVQTGTASADDFIFLNGYCGWRPGQLAQEVAAGVWFPAAGSPALALAARGGSGGGRPGGRALWHAVLDLMGGEYAALSSSMRGDVDDRLMRLVKRATEGGGSEGGSEDEDGQQQGKNEA